VNVREERREEGGLEDEEEEEGGKKRGDVAGRGRDHADEEDV
jgi:hypothetical protein